MKTVACIGAGTVGRAWAVVFARAGYQVRLFDALEGEAAGRALSGARQTLALFADNGMLDEPVETVLERIVPVGSIAEAVTDAAYVQESVREDRDIKRQVFSEIAAHAPLQSILASSTSAIPGSGFLGHIANPERALVVHPVNPPSLIPLVELCGTGHTSRKTIDQTRMLMTEAGMRPVVLNKEIDGFILNRLQFTLVAEALHLVGEGYCTPEDIDAVLTDGLALRWASLGPFEVAHLNAPDGLQGFVDRLGPMMKHLGKSARPDYDWTQDQIAEAHARLESRIPREMIAKRQDWRDSRILALRRMKRDVADPLA
jgi:L-gulonate 3-dehydrogenase